MAMYKIAQQFNYVDDLMVDLPIEVANDEDEVIVVQDLPAIEEVEVEMALPDDGDSFKLPFLPGADDILEMSPEEIEVESDEDKDNKKADKSDKEVSPKEFMNCMKDFFAKIPKHKGETTGLERALHYLKRGLTLMSKMLQQDNEGEIDISKAEDARLEMENGIDRLEKELNRRRKKASPNEDSMEKKASTKVDGIIVTVPLIVSSIARTCINSTVSSGKDIEHTFNRLAEKYKLSAREKMEVVQLLHDMNFPMRRDMGLMVNDEEKYEYTSTDNYNYSANYQA